MICSSCGITIDGLEDSHGLCPDCADKQRAENDRLHALKDGMTIHSGQIARADDPGEVMEHVIALQDISNEMALYGGERANVLDIISRGQGWARGPVRMNCLKLGIIEERRVATCVNR